MLGTRGISNALVSITDTQWLTKHGKKNPLRNTFCTFCLDIFPPGDLRQVWYQLFVATSHWLTVGEPNTLSWCVNWGGRLRQWTIVQLLFTCTQTINETEWVLRLRTKFETKLWNRIGSLLSPLGFIKVFIVSIFTLITTNPPDVQQQCRTT